MSTIQTFTFNGFQENTFVIYDNSKECVIIDPGCYSSSEQSELVDFIQSNELNPVKLLNTHCHIDHILGNKFVADTFQLGLEMHEADLGSLRAAPDYGQMYGFNMEPSPEPKNFLKDGDKISFGETVFDVLFTPVMLPAMWYLLITMKNM